MRIGKLTNDLLQKTVLDKIKHVNPAVTTGAGIGEDCCTVNTGSDAVVVSGDPITAAGNGAGALAIHVTANDIAAAGAAPVCAIVTMLVPPSAEIYDIETVASELAETAEKLGIEIGGGHTEVTDAVNRIVLNVTMIGKLIGEKMISTSGAVLGDTIVMSKYAAIEGSIIIADDFLENSDFSLAHFDVMQIDCLRDCLSVLTEGRVGADMKVHAMHDVTEGGVIGAVAEMCASSGCGAELDLSKIPVLPVTEKLCSNFNIDPYRFISSGSMLFSTDRPDELIGALADKKIDAFAIGKVTEDGILDAHTGERISDDVRDELYKLHGDML